MKGMPLGKLFTVSRNSLILRGARPQMSKHQNRENERYEIDKFEHLFPLLLCSFLVEVFGQWKRKWAASGKRGWEDKGEARIILKTENELKNSNWVTRWKEVTLHSLSQTTCVWASSSLPAGDAGPQWSVSFIKCGDEERIPSVVRIGPVHRYLTCRAGGHIGALSHLDTWFPGVGHRGWHHLGAGSKCISGPTQTYWIKSAFYQDPQVICVPITVCTWEYVILATQNYISNICFSPPAYPSALYIVGCIHVCWSNKYHLFRFFPSSLSSP